MRTHSRTFRMISGIALSVFGLVGAAGQASAHVVYGQSLFSDSSVIDPITGINGIGAAGSNQARTVRSNAGWSAGLNAATGGDTHNTRFLYFNLAQAQTIDFTINATTSMTGTTSNGASLLTPGYSLYSGAVPNLSHDGSPYSGQTPFAPWSPLPVQMWEVIQALQNGESFARTRMSRSLMIQP